MGPMESIEIEVETNDRLVTELTEQLDQFCVRRGDGLVNVFLPHVTAGIGLMETGSGSETDLERAIDELFPKDRPYRHKHGSEGHGRDHVLSCFISPSVVIPVSGGRPMLGTWQRLVLIDPNRDNRRRRVRFSFLS
jgi:secondary thiamine-phosphate synthase enzyme